MMAAVQTWWMILRVSLAERLVYRGDFALGTLMRFLPIVTQIFLWTAVFAARDEQSLAGFTRDELVAYYLLTMVARAFSSMPGLASGIAAQIRSGEIKKFLLQPVDLLGFLLLGRVAHKLAYYIVAIGPFALVFFLCRGYFTGWPSVTALSAGILSLVLAFLLGYFLEACMGLIGFWWLEVSSILFVYMLFSFFLSGHMFPIDMLPEPWHTLVSLTPLQFLAFFPAAVLLEKIQGWQLVWGLVAEAGWVLFFLLLSRVLFHFGTQRYSAYGG
ncbi:MAG: ABC-2 family transporter protein [Pirellulaceae bacterium]|nr:ABC-2 family transporter protein [Pirellulaceae bacterium]